MDGFRVNGLVKNELGAKGLGAIDVMGSHEYSSRQSWPTNRLIRLYSALRRNKLSTSDTLSEFRGRT